MSGIFTRKAQDAAGYRAQLAISRRPAKPIPKIKEKRLINGKWTRDYDPITGQATTNQGESQPGAPQESGALTPAQQRMREVAARLKERKS
jgi:hypothetical protein